MLDLQNLSPYRFLREGSCFPLLCFFIFFCSSLFVPVYLPWSDPNEIHPIIPWTPNHTLTPWPPPHRPLPWPTLPSSSGSACLLPHWPHDDSTCKHTFPALRWQSAPRPRLQWRRAIMKPSPLLMSRTLALTFLLHPCTTTTTNSTLGTMTLNRYWWWELSSWIGIGDESKWPPYKISRYEPAPTTSLQS